MEKKRKKVLLNLACYLPTDTTGFEAPNILHQEIESLIIPKI